MYLRIPKTICLELVNTYKVCNKLPCLTNWYWGALSEKPPLYEMLLKTPYILLMP